MLPANRRVKKESFDRIMKDSLFLPSNCLYMRILARKDLLPSRFSFVVPIKTEKTSVGRHETKRRLSAIVEKMLKTIKPGFDAVIFAKKGLKQESDDLLAQEISALLDRAGAR